MSNDPPSEPPVTLYETDTGRLWTRNAEGEWEPWDDAD